MKKDTFDYIILADVLEHLHDPERILQKALPYLKAKVFCSVPNILNRHVISDLLRGKLEYQDAGILDRTHLRFFTMDSIVRVFERCGMEVTQMMATYDTWKTGCKPEEFDETLPSDSAYADERQLFQVYHFSEQEERRRMKSDVVPLPATYGEMASAVLSVAGAAVDRNRRAGADFCG